MYIFQVAGGTLKVPSMFYIYKKNDKKAAFHETYLYGVYLLKKILYLTFF